MAANPKKLVIGQRVTSLPGNTINALTEGEFRDRQRKQARPQQAHPESRSCVIVRLKWEGTTELPPNRTVKLGEALVDPTEDHSAPFAGLQFHCDTPDAEDNYIAITLGPIPAGGMGYGFIPQATWAKVTIADAGDTHASPEASETLLLTSTAGRFPIIWKEEGTGEKWAVVLMATSGTTLRYCLATTTITAESGGTVGGGTVQPKKNDAGTLVDDGDPVTVANLHPLQFESGWRGYFDDGKSPPEIVVMTCVPE